MTCHAQVAQGSRLDPYKYCGEHFLGLGSACFSPSSSLALSCPVASCSAEVCVWEGRAIGSLTSSALCPPEPSVPYFFSLLFQLFFTRYYTVGPYPFSLHGTTRCYTFWYAFYSLCDVKSWILALLPRHAGGVLRFACWTSRGSIRLVTFGRWVCPQVTYDGLCFFVSRRWDQFCESRAGFIVGLVTSPGAAVYDLVQGALSRAYAVAHLAPPMLASFAPCLPMTPRIALIQPLRPGIIMLLRGVIPPRYLATLSRGVIPPRYLMLLLRGVIPPRYLTMLSRGVIPPRYFATLSRGVIPPRHLATLSRGVIPPRYLTMLSRGVIPPRYMLVTILMFAMMSILMCRGLALGIGIMLLSWGVIPIRYTMRLLVKAQTLTSALEAA